MREYKKQLLLKEFPFLVGIIDIADSVKVQRVDDSVLAFRSRNSEYYSGNGDRHAITRETTQYFAVCEDEKARIILDICAIGGDEESPDTVGDIILAEKISPKLIIAVEKYEESWELYQESGIIKQNTVKIFQLKNFDLLKHHERMFQKAAVELLKEIKKGTVVLR